MEMLRPIKFAIKELEQFLFIERVLNIYKNPEIGKIQEHYELWIFCWALVFTHVLVYFFINLFSDYFLFNPDKHFILVKLALVFVENAFVLATSISLISGVFFKILGIRTINFYIGLIFLRVIYVFSLTLILLSVVGVIEFNNIFKSGRYMPNLNQSIFFIFLGFCWLKLHFRMLIIPIYKIISNKSNVVGMFSVGLILLFSVKINHFVSTLFPVDFFLNIPEFTKRFSS
ncbi:MAG: hypothetical protein H0T84_14975 [Tatlockia sp.]|nr:hypothetical protein [Tatlockia sp.]